MNGYELTGTLYGKANDDTKVYNGVPYSGGKGVVYTGFMGSDTEASVIRGSLTYSGNSQGAVDAGGYTITAGGQTAQNYVIHYVNGFLTITPAPWYVWGNDVQIQHGETVSRYGYRVVDTKGNTVPQGNTREVKVAGPSGTPDIGAYPINVFGGEARNSNYYIAEWISGTLLVMPTSSDYLYITAKLYGNAPLALDYFREKLNGNLPTWQQIRTPGSPWESLPIDLSIFHDKREGNAERKFVHPDGREVVFDGDTHGIITDRDTKGTFNFYSYRNTLGHGFLDVALSKEVAHYYLVGHGRDDIITDVGNIYQNISLSIADSIEANWSGLNNIFIEAPQSFQQISTNLNASINKAWDSYDSHTGELGSTGFFTNNMPERFKISNELVDKTLDIGKGFLSFITAGVAPAADMFATGPIKAYYHGIADAGAAKYGLSQADLNKSKKEIDLAVDVIAFMFETCKFYKSFDNILDSNWRTIVEGNPEAQRLIKDGAIIYSSKGVPKFSSRLGMIIKEMTEGLSQADRATKQARESVSYLTEVYKFVSEHTE